MTAAFHDGERKIQLETGEAAIAEQNKALIGDVIVRGAVPFVEKQPMVVVGSRNAAGELWASILIGQYGFIKVPDPGTIAFHTRQITSSKADIFFSNIGQDPEIGSLFIELDSRRRLRVNGRCRIEGAQIKLQVRQAYPNCPRYIQKRSVSAPEYFQEVAASTIEGTGLTERAVSWIQDADTLFVATADAGGQLDASHRGGPKHFVEVMGNTLKIPDYNGNSMFNTFGNMVQNDKAGLLFIDYDQRQTLQLTGTASLLFDQTSEDDLLNTKGTGRYWLFHTSRWIHTIDHHHVTWQFLEYAPLNLPTPAAP